MTVALVAALLLGANNYEWMKFAVDGDGSMFVVVAPLQPDAIESGANRDAIQNQAEVALRKCGVRVFGPDEPQHDVRSTAEINVNVGVREQVYVANLSVMVLRMERIRGIEVPLLLFRWEVPLLGSLGTLGGNVRKVLTEGLDDLCNQYLKAKQARAKPTVK